MRRKSKAEKDKDVKQDSDFHFLSMFVSHSLWLNWAAPSVTLWICVNVISILQEVQTVTNDCSSFNSSAG